MFRAIPMNPGDAAFVAGLLTRETNVAALHLAVRTAEEWTAGLKNTLRDPDEANFIIDMDGVPAAWLRMNGLCNDKTDKAWISMLVVHDERKRQGIGSYAVKFAEEYAVTNGFSALGVHTTADNIPAQKCYEKLGFERVEESMGAPDDGIGRLGYVYHKVLDKI